MIAGISVTLILAIAGTPSIVGQQQLQNELSSLFPNGFPANYSANDSAIDVQYTSCKIITDRIVATAEGKFSRFCHGICNINETNARLHRIEALLTTETENIKRRLFRLEHILSSGDDNIRKPGSMSAGVDTRRLWEVATYNGTVSSPGPADGGHAAFVYYWRVDSFWRLAFSEGRACSRPFYVSPRGYRIELTVDSDMATRKVRVAAVPATGEYDASLRWPFVHRLRVSVLDQTDVTPEDIVSRVRDDVRCGPPPPAPATSNQLHQSEVCASVEFGHDVLTYRSYADGDALLVKLTVFLQQKTTETVHI